MLATKGKSKSSGPNKPPFTQLYTPRSEEGPTPWKPLFKGLKEKPLLSQEYPDVLKKIQLEVATIKTDVTENFKETLEKQAEMATAVNNSALDMGMLLKKTCSNHHDVLDRITKIDATMGVISATLAALKDTINAIQTDMKATRSNTQEHQKAIDEYVYILPVSFGLLFLQSKFIVGAAMIIVRQVSVKTL